MFYTFLSTDDIRVIPSTVIDSGTCSLVVGKQNLKKSMKKLRINKLEDEKNGHE